MLIQPSGFHDGVDGAIEIGWSLKSKTKTPEIPFETNGTDSGGHGGILYYIVAGISRNNLNETSTKEFRADLISQRVRVLADCTDSAGKIRRKLQRANNFLSSLTVDCCCYYYSDLSRVYLLTRNVAVLVVGGGDS